MINKMTEDQEWGLRRQLARCREQATQWRELTYANVDDNEVDSVIETLDDVYLHAAITEEQEWQHRRELARASERLFGDVVGRSSNLNCTC